MLRALLAYFSVFSVSIKSRSDGEQHAIIRVRLLPNVQKIIYILFNLGLLTINKYLLKNPEVIGSV